MNFELFIARRLFGTKGSERRVSRPAVTIAQWGVAVGMMVMIASLCIVVGFKHSIRDKIVGFGSHIQVRNYEAAEYGELPVTTTDADIQMLRGIDGVSHVQTYIHKPGLVAAGDEFEGVIVKGIGNDYDISFFADNLIDGEMPQLSDTAASNKIVLSGSIARRLKVDVGQKINLYFVQEGVKMRRMEVAAIYETHLSELDELIAITDIYTARRLNGWGSGESSGVEIAVEDYDRMETVRESLLPAMTAIADGHSQRLYVQTVEEANPQLFAWLDVLDSTVWIILVLVLGIAGFTMVSGLLILILEKSNLIGILKALGAKDISVRKVFLYYGMFIIGRGMLWGNVIGFSLSLLQKYTGIVKLDPSMYYMDSVPIGFTWLLLPLNIIMFVVSVAMLVLPSALISRIEPVKAIKFE